MSVPADVEAIGSLPSEQAIIIPGEKHLHFYVSLIFVSLIFVWGHVNDCQGQNQGADFFFFFSHNLPSL